ncbi:CinA family protein [Rhizobiaceae bacterium]|nr:CinA family protein [Rhizobiaceae bacterium]
MTAAADVLAACRARGWTLCTAESCTGGLIAAALTDVAGSSDVFQCGFVTYSNAAKTRMIGVSAALLDTHGAVSEPVAEAMALGALAASGTDLAVSVTGIAGPGGGSAEKPVGLVFIAVATAEGATVHRCQFDGISRSEVRVATRDRALELLLGAAR